MKADDLLSDLDRHLRAKKDHEIILLKGHLLLEQVLNQMLLRYIDNEHLNKLDLYFAKKLDLLDALSGKLPDPWLYGHLLEINRIRNKLSHHLDFSDWDDDLKKWACNVIGYTPKSIDRKSTYRNTLLKAFYLLSGMLKGIQVAQGAIEKRNSCCRKS